MMRVDHVRQNLVRERVSGFGRLAVSKIDRAFGRAGRALRRAHRESAPGCSGGARVACSGSGRRRRVPCPRVGGAGCVGGSASRSPCPPRRSVRSGRVPVGVSSRTRRRWCVRSSGRPSAGGRAERNIVSSARFKAPICFRIGYSCHRRRPPPCVRRAEAILPLNARRHVAEDGLIKPLMPIVWRPMLVNRDLGGRKRRRVG